MIQRGIKICYTLNMENFDDIIRKANEGNKEKFKKEGREVIGMNESKDVELIQGQQIELYTNGVGGCTVVAAAVEYPDGRTSAHLSHFDSFGTQVEEIRLSSLAHEDPSKFSIAIIVRGDWEKQGDKWKMIPKQDAQIEIDKLLSSLEGLSKVEVKILPYSESIQIGELTRGVSFTVKVDSSDGKTKAKLMWWEGSESLL
jgi:hypothetical protein